MKREYLTRKEIVFDVSGYLLVTVDNRCYVVAREGTRLEKYIFAHKDQIFKIRTQEHEFAMNLHNFITPGDVYFWSVSESFRFLIELPF